jgi:hypothetical protein
MTGRAAPMRRRVCVHCHTKFLPKRLDAETCSNRCRQAVHRKKQIRLEAESVFNTTLQIAQNTADEAWLLETYQHCATMANVEADRVFHKHIRFMGTHRGIIAVWAHRENDLPWPVPWKPILGAKELKHDPADPEAGDPEVIEAVIEALKCETLGGSFIQREYEKECQALLRGPVQRISLFVHDPDWLNKPPPGGWPSLSTAWADDWDQQIENTGDNYAPGDNGAGELLAGGGYTVFHASKGHP